MKKEKKGKWTKDKEVWQYQRGDMKSGIEPGGVVDIRVGGGGGHSVASEDPQNHTKTRAVVLEGSCGGSGDVWQYCPHCGKELK